jgi:hypothetical protein
MDFTSNFKDKSEKETPYKIFVEEYVDYEAGTTEEAWKYSGEFKITVKSIAPNYDFTVYNMDTEP